ncbi:MAG: glutamate racemase [Oscillospiraceae bacterium]
MDNRPIGVFDSGVGGLTAVRELRRILPAENIIYFGDSGRAPYGGRPLRQITHIARQDAAFVAEKGVKAMLVACGTMDSNALSVIKGSVDVPVSGVVIPAAKAAAATTKNGRIGVIATEATARSDAFGKVLTDIDSSIISFTRACPLLVPMVEEGIARDDPRLQNALEAYLAPLLDMGVDTLLLGCTHYPLLKDAIGGFMGSGVALVDSGAEGARSVARHLAEHNLLCDGRGEQHGEYYTSGDERAFAYIAELFLGEDVAGSIHPVAPFIL